MIFLVNLEDQSKAQEDTHVLETIFICIVYIFMNSVHISHKFSDSELKNLCFQQILDFSAFSW